LNDNAGPHWASIVVTLTIAANSRTMELVQFEVLL